MKIGYVGLGNMGSALATRLQLKHDLVVFDMSADAMVPFVERGARAAADLGDVARECRIVILCLPTSDLVQQVIFGEGGLAVELQPGAIIIDQTTGDPQKTREMAVSLSTKGIRLVDAPVSGGRAGAEAGSIAIMVGAEDKDWQAVRPVLEAISPNVFHAGKIGNGQVIKLVNNLLSGVQRALSFEALAVAEKCGVDPKIATSILVASGGRNAYLEKMMGPRILEGKLKVGFTLELAHKDLRLACQLGTDAGVPMVFGNAARDLYQIGINQMGGNAEVDTLGLVFDRLAKSAVVPAEHDWPESGTKAMNLDRRRTGTPE